VSSGLPELRASDAERDRAIVQLREAAAEGRLTLEEFTQRMSLAVEARTHGELDELMHDLPAVSAPAPPAARTRLRSAFATSEARRCRSPPCAAGR